MEKATLTIQRKLMAGSEFAVYRQMYQHMKKGMAMEQAILTCGEDPKWFGSIRFLEMEGGVYVEHIPFTSEGKERQLTSEMDIPPEWLFCFSFKEMNVIGLDMGVFQAETTVDEALKRLQWMEINSASDLYAKRRELYIWLSNHTRLDDRLRVCSDWIYYHPEGKYDYDFVKKDINRRIACIKPQISCTHWKKTAS